MAERTISLSIEKLFNGDHNHPDISRFIGEFSSILHTGDGRRPQMLERLNIDTAFPVRLLIGIPAKSLTREQRRIAEGYCSMIFGCDLSDTKGLWVYNKGWQPKNPGRKPASIHDSTLDTEWMFSLGIPKSVWANDILLAPTVFSAQTKHLPSSMMRYLLALVAYGFSDPHQFFTATPEQDRR